jgi:hypothetical protein
MKHLNKWTAGTAVAAVVIFFCFSGKNSYGGTLTIGSGSTVDINGGLLNMNCQAVAIRDGGSLLLQDGQFEKKGLVTVETGGTYSVTGGSVVECSKNSFFLLFNDQGLPILYVLPKSSL